MRAIQLCLNVLIGLILIPILIVLLVKHFLTELCYLLMPKVLRFRFYTGLWPSEARGGAKEILEWYDRRLEFYSQSKVDAWTVWKLETRREHIRKLAIHFKI